MTIVDNVFDKFNAVIANLNVDRFVLRWSGVVDYEGDADIDVNEIATKLNDAIYNDGDAINTQVFVDRDKNDNINENRFWFNVLSKNTQDET